MTTSAVPETFAQLRQTIEFRRARKHLRKINGSILITGSVAFMGQGTDLVLTANGFQTKTGRSGMSAAFTGDKTRFGDPIRSSAEVAAKALGMVNQSFSDGLCDPPKKTEAEIVQCLWRSIEYLLQD